MSLELRALNHYKNYCFLFKLVAQSSWLIAKKKPLQKERLYFLLNSVKLLHFYFSTSFFQLSNDFVGFSFRDTLFYWFWSTVNQVFCFFQSQTRLYF